MDDSENKIEHNDGEFYDDDGERYISVEQSIIGSCKEIKEMIAGRKPKMSWEEAKRKIQAEIAAEEALERRQMNERNRNRSF